MKVLLILLATRAATAWAPPFKRTDAAPSWKVPSAFHQRDDSLRDPGSAFDAFDQIFPQTLGDNDDGSADISVQRNSKPQRAPQSSVIRSSSSKAYTTHTDAGTLVIEFPAAGWDTNSAITGAFSVAWFSALLPATTLAAAPILLPFFVAGGLVAKSAFVEPFTSERLSIGDYGWSLERSRYGKEVKVWSGATWDLREAVVVDRSTVTPESVRYRYELQLLCSKAKSLSIGSVFNSPEEPTKLAHAINKQLKRVRSNTNEDDPMRFFLPSM